MQVGESPWTSWGGDGPSNRDDEAPLGARGPDAASHRLHRELRSHANHRTHSRADADRRAYREPFSVAHP